MKPPVIRLHRKHQRRIQSGHVWVFSNEIDGSVAELPAGGTVDIAESGGRFLGRGYANPRSLIAVRLLTKNRAETIDAPGFFAARLTSALQLRQALYGNRQSMRLINAESDGLPGLVIDRYGDVLAVQITTLGMEMRKPLLEAAIRDILNPAGVVLCNTNRMRELEGLDKEHEVWFGDVPETVDIDEFGVTFRVKLQGGQKTGHFFDQAENRRFAGSLCAGRTVLDTYSYSGGWALHALKAGAKRALTIEKSETCCAQIETNATLNSFGDQVDILHGEARKAMMALVAQGQQFGAVVLDPPAFAKSRKVAGRALKGYQEINALGLSLVKPGGFLFSSSCSYHVEEDRFIKAIQQAASSAGKRIQLIRRGEQSPDHPVLPHIPETRYLKSLAFYVTQDI